MNNLPEELAKIVKEVDEQIAGRLHEIDEQVIYNQAKVLEAFVDNAVVHAQPDGSLRIARSMGVDSPLPSARFS